MTQALSRPALGRRPLLTLLAAGLATGTARAARAAEPAVLRAAPAPGLYELAYSPRQDALFVASAGGFGDGALPSRVLRLDPQTLAVQAEIALPLKGFGVALDEVAGRLYVGHSLDAAVTAIDIATNQVIGTAKLAAKVRGADGKESAPYSLRQLQLDASGQRLYAPGLGMQDSVLYAVDTGAMRLDKAITGIGPGATGIALDAAGGRIFVSTLLGRLVTVDLARQAVVRDVAAGGLEQPLNLAFDAAANRLLSVDQGMESMPGFQAKMQPGYTSTTPGHRLAALNPDDGSLLRQGPTGKGPVSLRLDAGRGRVYVTDREAGSVSVLEAAGLTVVATVPLGAHPNSMALDERRNALFVTVKNTREAGRSAAESVVRIAF